MSKEDTVEKSNVYEYGAINDDMEEIFYEQANKNIVDNEDIFMNEAYHQIEGEKVGIGTRKRKQNGGGGGGGGGINLEMAIGELKIAIDKECSRIGVSGLSSGVIATCKEMIMDMGICKPSGSQGYYHGFTRKQRVKCLILVTIFLQMKNEGIHVSYEKVFSGMNKILVRNTLHIVCKLYDIQIPTESFYKICNLVVGMFINGIKKLEHNGKIKTNEHKITLVEDDTLFKDDVQDIFNPIEKNKYSEDKYSSIVHSTINKAEMLCKILGFEHYDVSKTLARSLLISIFAFRISVAKGEVFTCCNGEEHISFINDIFKNSVIASYVDVLSNDNSICSADNILVSSMSEATIINAKKFIYCKLVKAIKFAMQKERKRYETDITKWNNDLLFRILSPSNIESMIYKIVNYFDILLKCPYPWEEQKKSSSKPVIKSKKIRKDSEHLQDFLRKPEEIKFMEDIWSAYYE